MIEGQMHLTQNNEGLASEQESASREALEKLQKIGEKIRKGEECEFKPESAKLIDKSMINIYFKNDAGEEVIATLYLHPHPIVRGTYWWELAYPGGGHGTDTFCYSLDQIKEQLKKRWGVEVE